MRMYRSRTVLALSPFTSAMLMRRWRGLSRWPETPTKPLFISKRRKRTPQRSKRRMTGNSC